MSTRSLIMVTGKDHYGRPGTVRIYKHSDGYPTGNLPLITATIERYQHALLTDYNKYKKEKKITTFEDYIALPENAFAKRHLDTEVFSGFLLGESVTVYGIGARLQNHFADSFTPEHLGDQWDSEWIYIIDLDRRDVSIYQGNFKSGPQAGFKNGPTNPLEYCKKLKVECQKREATKTNKCVAKLQATGFTVNSPNPEFALKPIKLGEQTCQPDMIITRGE